MANCNEVCSVAIPAGAGFALSQALWFKALQLQTVYQRCLQGVPYPGGNGFPHFVCKEGSCSSYLNSARALNALGLVLCIGTMGWYYYRMVEIIDQNNNRT